MDDARNTWLIDEGYVTEGDSQDSRNPSVTRVPFQPYSAISNCAKARVRIGDIVMLENDVDNLFIRSSSDNHPSSNIIGYFKPGQKAKVISGPECSWGWMMWRIQRLNDGFEGWVAESDGKEFWLKLEG